MRLNAYTKCDSELTESRLQHGKLDKQDPGMRSLRGQGEYPLKDERGKALNLITDEDVNAPLLRGFEVGSMVYDCNCSDGNALTARTLTQTLLSAPLSVARSLLLFPGPVSLFETATILST